MQKSKKQPSEALPEGTTWEVELKRVGFVRRIFMARHWYGADWWFVAISAVGGDIYHYCNFPCCLPPIHLMPWLGRVSWRRVLG